MKSISPQRFSFLTPQRFNDTFIEMSQAAVRPVKKNFTCRQDRNNVGLAEVLIDDEMSPVNDFKCRTTNLTDILCSFTKPTSFAPIKYRFLYAFDDETVRIFRRRVNDKFID